MEVSVLGLEICCVAVHVVRAVHTRSLNAVGAMDSYWPALQNECSEHCRSLVGVSVTDSHCVAALHVVSAAHARSLAAVGAAVSYSPARHTV